jgi:UDP-N-acetylglucosamine 4,6-dehydratase
MDWSNLTVLVTGGTGSFGQKFTEVVLKDYHPRKLIIFSRDEHKQSEMRERFPHPTLRFFLGDVRDLNRLLRAFDGVDVVVHAAALKQIPILEYNPFEAVKTNILGTQNVVEAAVERGIAKVVVISTDKAVNPISLYGATKLCAEKISVDANAYTGVKRTRIACVRYGNVVGSRGSVVPLFLEQRKTRSVTITDKRMTRFWMTIEQGVRFVIRCIELMHGGEIFVPRIPSMRITDLAQAIAPDCELKVVGIRPGEKLHEVLLTEDEARRTRAFDEFFVIEPEYVFKSEQRWIGGKSLPDGFRYTSDENDAWLTSESLRKMVESD